MKREEKNQQMRRRILDSAEQEFSAHGYGAGSINTICSTGEFSKGILYHYFQTKDEVYLACVTDCFQALTAYLKKKMEEAPAQGVSLLEHYFQARLFFFRAHPVWQSIFCGAVITPPAHLVQELQHCRAEFDAFNLEVLERLLAPLELRSDCTQEEAVELFRQYQDYLNARDRVSTLPSVGLEAHEASCRKALSVLLYGIIARPGEALI